MPLKVNISLSSGGRFKPVSSHTLHDKHITVGRDKECTLTLEDTQKHVSRVHAEIDQDTDCYWVKVVSKVNPIAVNGKRHMFGERVPVVEGDQVHVGLYKLEIIEADVAPPVAKAPPAPAVVDASEETTIAPRAKAPPPAAPPARYAPEIDSEEATFPPPELARAAAPAPQPVPAAAPGKSMLPDSAAAEEESTYVPPVKASPAAPPPAPAAKAAPPVTSKLPEHEILDDEVTYIPPMWARQASNRAVGGNTDATNEDLTGIRRPPTEPAKPSAKAEAPQAPEQTPAPSSADLDFDLSDVFDSVPAPVVAKQAPAPQPDVEEGFSEDLTYVRRPSPKPPGAADPAPAFAPPPVAKAPSAPSAEPPKPAKEKAPFASPLAEIQARIAAKSGGAKSQPAASKPPAGADASVHAFLEAAGLSQLQVDDPETFMRNSGAMVRAAVGVVLTLLADRAATRKELGAEDELSTGQNPIASIASPDEVISFLFDPKRPAIGDTDPAEAFGDACTELRSHQAALLAGMRAAVTTALLRIDPKRIEQEHGANLGMLNITRKAKLWDLSVAEHERLAREVEDNFSELFGREILAAFTDQAKKTGG